MLRAGMPAATTFCPLTSELAKVLLFIFLRRVKAGTGFGGELPMSVYPCFREHLLQHANQHHHALALLLRAGVLRLSVSRETSHVAHPDARPVMTLAMGADPLNAASHLNPSVRAYHEVIADASEALRLMPTVDILSREILPLTSGRAMNNNLSNPSHIINY